MTQKDKDGWIKIVNKIIDLINEGTPLTGEQLIAIALGEIANQLENPAVGSVPDFSNVTSALNNIANALENVASAIREHE